MRLLQILGELKEEAEEEPEGEDLDGDIAGNKHVLYFTQGQLLSNFTLVPVCTVLQSSL